VGVGFGLQKGIGSGLILVIMKIPGTGRCRYVSKGERGVLPNEPNPYKAAVWLICNRREEGKGLKDEMQLVVPTERRSETGTRGSLKVNPGGDKVPRSHTYLEKKSNVLECGAILETR